MVINRIFPDTETYTSGSSLPSRIGVFATKSTMPLRYPRQRKLPLKIISRPLEMSLVSVKVGEIL